jgi:Short C-terminal domain/Phospholipase_D-nuclease N-terminal
MAATAANRLAQGATGLIATSYPLLEAFETILIFFAFFVWLWLLFTVFADLFRRSDISGWAKVAWIIFIIIIPYLGVFVYLIAEHKGMAERSIRAQEGAKAQMDEYVRSVASESDPTEQIAKAKKLLDDGAISQAEFDQIKQKALAGS